MNVQTSVDFYIGMAENGISLLGKYKGLLNNLNYITSNTQVNAFIKILIIYISKSTIQHCTIRTIMQRY